MSEERIAEGMIEIFALETPGPGKGVTIHAIDDDPLVIVREMRKFPPAKCRMLRLVVPYGTGTGSNRDD